MALYKFLVLIIFATISYILRNLLMLLLAGFGGFTLILVTSWQLTLLLLRDRLGGQRHHKRRSI